MIMMENEFVKKTRKALDSKNVNFNKDRFACKGFDSKSINDKPGKCILVLGLNPAGGKDDAHREAEHPEREYICYIPELKNDLEGWHYPPYFKKIYELAEGVFGEGQVKWPWCNYSKQVLDEVFPNISALEDADRLIVERFYENHQDSPITIYFGDMFYYHEGNSKDLPLKRDLKYNRNASAAREYYRTMLKMHVEELKKLNKTIEFVYINNAQVSNGLCLNKSVTHETIDNVEVFYGPMLSGGNMDNFSLNRLINEIKSVINL